MTDLKYIINSVYLYDNQLKFDYLFLHDKMDGLPYRLNQKLNEIYQDPEWKVKKLCEKKALELLQIFDVKGIKINDYIELVKVGDTNIDRYKAYHIYWNETKSGINLFKWKRAEVWCQKHPSQVWTMRLDEYKENRIKEIRNNSIERIL
jgi:hypothetical protein